MAVHVALTYNIPGSSKVSPGFCICFLLRENVLTLDSFKEMLLVTEQTRKIETNQICFLFLYKESGS